MMFLEQMLINFQTRRKDEMKSVLGFKKDKVTQEKISMVKCYDYNLAKIINSTDIDCILV
ncbi:3-methyl-2-oxobutanoate hydroxymethyltransferase, partial [Francisella tularensis subsp. holarctica]|nr:3-methyl-2-oxobutanoate hydroxymethyltransferase [Francisella tularensis subsp. holarctica]